jgi:hypothetical protein
VLEENEEDAARTGSVVLTSTADGNSYTLFKVTQSNLSATAENDGMDNKFAQMGLGRGYLVGVKKNQLKSAIVNLAQLKARIKANPDLYDGLYSSVEDSYTSTSSGDTIVKPHKVDLLHVHVVVDVSFSSFKLNIAGEYHGSDVTDNLDRVIQASQNYQIVTGSCDVVSVVSMWESKEIDSTVLNAGFRKVKRAVEANPSEANLADLNSKFGPAITIESKGGGAIVIALKYNGHTYSDSMAVDGQLTGNIKETVKLDGQAYYKKVALDVFKNGQYSISVQGGDPKLHSAITKGYIEDDPKVAEYVETWKNSIQLDETKQNTIMLDCTLVGIWTLFSGETAQKVKAYMLEKHPSLKNVEGLQE